MKSRAKAFYRLKKAAIWVALAAALAVGSLPFALRSRTKYVPLDPATFAPEKVHVAVFAHQDDEVACAGAIQRQGARSEYIWVTNGDGPAQKNGEPPAAYAEQRRRETEAALRALGKSSSQLKSLGYSEREDYLLFEQVQRSGTRTEALKKVGQMADRVYEELKAAHPDVLWTSAYQAGHPEHDLVHLLVCSARTRIEAEEHRHIPVLVFPEYQFTSVPPFLIPFRFKPWKEQTVLYICLDPEELRHKLALGSKYPSQTAFVRQFTRGIAAAGTLNRFRIGGRKLTYPDLAKKEVFQEVPEAFDHTASPNAKPWENYMFARGSFRSTELIAHYLQSRGPR